MVVRRGPAQLSPDGRWVAYTSDISGEFDIYVQPFGRPGQPRQVSVNGGTDPRWRMDGGELFYLSADGQLTAVTLTMHRDRVTPGPPRPLFSVSDATPTAPSTSAYDVSPKGDRFLIRIPRENVRSMPLTVLLNWQLPSDQ